MYLSLPFWKTSHNKLPNGYLRARKEAEETMIKGLLHHFLLVHPEMAPPRLQGKACTCSQDPRGGTGTWEQMCACCTLAGVCHPEAGANKSLLGDFQNSIVPA